MGILRFLSDKMEEIKGIRLSRNFGKESAITADLQFASGDAIIVMDRDLQHLPQIIPAMIRFWKEKGGNIVEAVKTDHGNEHLSSKIGTRLFYRMMRQLTELDLDNSSDFKKAQIPFLVGERISGKSRWSVLRLITLLTASIF